MPILGPLITSYRLGNLLNVTHKVLHQLRLSGSLVPHVEINGVNHYLVEEVDEFLATNKRGFPVAPTLRMLEDRNLRFITSEDAMRLTELTHNGLGVRLHDGRLWGIKVSGRLLFSQQRAMAYALMESDEGFIPFGIVMHVIGFTKNVVRELCQQGRLEAGRRVTNRRFGAVTRKSLLALLSELLPDWISAEDWLEDRLESTRPLLTLREATRQLGYAKYQQTTKLIQGRRLQYLTAPSGRDYYRIAPESVDAILEVEPVLTNEEIAWCFGVSRQAVEQWKQAQLMVCELHNHEDQDIKEACLAELLRPLLSPGLSPTRWIASRRKSRHQLVPQFQVAQRFGMSQAEIASLAQAGRLQGVRTPVATERWHFTRSAVLEGYTRQQKGIL